MENHHSYANVPIIDISPLSTGDLNAKMEVAKQIDEACQDSGFFYAANHGLDLQGFVDVTTKFHQTITDEEKNQLSIAAYNADNVKQIRNGYSPPVKGKKPQENLCFLNPSFTEDHPAIKANLPGHEVNVWPDDSKHPGFREYQESYYRKVFDLSVNLLRGFALALGRSECFFDDHITKDGTLSSVVLIRYPYLANYPPVEVASDGTNLGFGSHKDVSLITVLFQSNVQNLQVETPEGYKDIPSSRDCFLVNVGSYMDYITNGYYKAPVHRVKFVNAERLSLPFFVNLDYDGEISPFIPHNEDVKSENTRLKYGQYLQQELLTLIDSNGQT